MLPTILFVVGARPNFIKLAPLCVAIKKMPDLDFKIVHTGQHYDDSMSTIFFDELDIPKPDYYLNIGSDTHARQTAHIMMALEDLCLKNSFAAMVVIGDVNSTLAGALVAAKLNISIVHIEAGLRSFNRSMPEEINRIATDHMADLLFAPTQTAMKNLNSEGLSDRSWFSGDVMYDMAIRGIKLSQNKIQLLEQLGIEPEEYYLSTLHRPYNVDDSKQLREIINALSELDKQVVLSVHPRLQKNLERFQIIPGDNIKLTHPLGYLEFLTLEKNAAKIITDSGGIQKEAFFLKKPCITLRPETEWAETTLNGANILVKDRSTKAIKEVVMHPHSPKFNTNPYGDGKASEKILNILKQELWN
jgi:UDP-GlcNAc3NAcA epimerase